ncbi:hypothetical protein F511_35499 [Dorcoceras hygrometricum]|uniref:Uncharacterized protein n=1 Tax=Dorcoceras hygrometricum TaxID=472368 RepID=A0A2Z7BJT0_9LAMI|nr:hypothetical protein F511_35499 [Dorcoceras hygrometricum]
MQAMVRVVAHPSVSIGPGGGPAGGFPVKGGRSHEVEKLEIEYVGPLGSPDLNDADDPAVDFIPSGGEDLLSPAAVATP